MQIDIQSISTILGMSSIIVGVMMSLITLRNYTRARQLALFLEFNKIALQKEFIQDVNEINNLWIWDSMEDFFAKYGPEADNVTFSKFMRVGSYFDAMGKLLEKKLIDASFVPGPTSVTIIAFWEKVESMSEEMNIAMKRPGAWDSVKLLYDLMISRE
ncbi:MAG: hypothetical protein ACXAEB_15280 [Candidatus Thorarchaeota archaeon]